MEERTFRDEIREILNHAVHELNRAEYELELAQEGQVKDVDAIEKAREEIWHIADSIYCLEYDIRSIK